MSSLDCFRQWVGWGCCKVAWFELYIIGIEDADNTCDILEWGYKQFDRNNFHFVWASPPCTGYSFAGCIICNLLKSNIVMTKNMGLSNFRVALAFFNPRQIFSYRRPMFESWIIHIFSYLTPLSINSKIWFQLP